MAIPVVLGRLHALLPWGLIVVALLLGIGAAHADEEDGITAYVDPAQSGGANTDPSGIALGPDGRIWVPWTDGTVVAVSPTGDFTHYPLPDACLGITAGAANDLWLAGQSTLVHLSTTGSVLGHYAISANDPYYEGITLGPDGNLWMGLANDDLGHFSLRTHTMTSVALPSTSDLPVGLTSGPDGALWVTCQTWDGSPDQVVRVSTTGSLLSWDFPDETQIGSITTGPDGALWFTLGDANAIGRLTTTGSLTTRHASDGALPTSITVGSDGELWFSETGNDALGRISTTAILTEYRLSSQVAGNPAQMAAGADGRVWFVDDDPFSSMVYALQISDAVRAAGSTTGGTTSGAPTHASLGSDGSGSGCGLGGGVAALVATLVVTCARGTRTLRRRRRTT